MHRDEEIGYAQAHDIPIPVTIDNPYSIDENLWGRSVEAGILEDPWLEPEEDAYAWTASPISAPDRPQEIEIEFDEGIPVALDGETLGGVELVTRLNRLAGSHGVGRIDHIENRLIGIKSREVYEAPAAIVLHTAHDELETLTLSKDQMRFKAKIVPEIADLIYNGLWFSALHQDLAALVASTQRYVTGAVRLKLYKGRCWVVGRRAQQPLYDKGLATYESGDTFDHDAATGFIGIFGLPLRTQAHQQWLGLTSDQILRLSAGGPSAHEEPSTSPSGSAAEVGSNPGR